MKGGVGISSLGSFVRVFAQGSIDDAAVAADDPKNEHSKPYRDFEERSEEAHLVCLRWIM